MCFSEQAVSSIAAVCTVVFVKGDIALLEQSTGERETVVEYSLLNFYNSVSNFIFSR